MKINIKVIPRSSQNKVVGEMVDGTLKIKLTAAPVDGEANKKLIELLAGHFGVPKSKIKIVKGMTSRNKIIEIGGHIAQIM